MGIVATFVLIVFGIGIALLLSVGRGTTPAQNEVAAPVASAPTSVVHRSVPTSLLPTKGTGSVQRSSTTTEKKRNGIEVTESFNGKGEGPVIAGDVVLANGSAFLGGYELDDPTRVRWQSSCLGAIGRFVEGPKRVVHRGLVMVGCATELRAIDVQTGQVRWKTLMANVPSGHQVHGTDSLFAFEEDRGVEVVDIETGVTRWHTDLGADYIVVDADADSVYIGANERLRAFDAQTGAPRWDIALPVSTMAVTADALYAKTVDYEVARVNRTTGAIDWRTPRDQARVGRGWVSGANGRIVLLCGDEYRQLTAYDASTGDMRWSYRAANGEQLAAMVEGDRVAVSVEPEIFMLDADSGAVLATYAGVMSALPSIGSGKVASIDISQQKVDVFPVP